MNMKKEKTFLSASIEEIDKRYDEQTALLNGERDRAKGHQAYLLAREGTIYFKV